MKILIVTNFVPYPPISGAELRIFNLLRHISSQHEVSLLSLYNPSTGEEKEASHLKTFCTRVELVPRKEYPKREHQRRILQGLLRQEPWQNINHYFEEMADKLRTLTENEHFDIVQIHHTHMAPYVKAISPKCQCRKILFLHNVDYVQYHRMILVRRNWLKPKILTNWLFSKRATLRYARYFDKCIVVSEPDRDLLKQAMPDLDINVLVGGVDTADYPLLADEPPTPTLAFVGNMQYLPNVDGALFFCQEIFPLIKQQVPDAKLLIVGKKPREAVQALTSADITVTGYVDNVIPYYQQASVSIVPLRAGGGTRLKIPEAMALGRPVVSTALGCEGLAVTHDENILIANNPTDFAMQTVRLLKDKELRQRLVTNGRQLVETTYDWWAVAQQLLHIYNEAMYTQPHRSKATRRDVYLQK